MKNCSWGRGLELEGLSCLFVFCLFFVLLFVFRLNEIIAINL